MYGIKVLLNTLVVLLVVCALVVLWYDDPACGAFVSKSVISLFILIAVMASRETATL